MEQEDLSEEALDDQCRMCRPAKPGCDLVHPAVQGMGSVADCPPSDLRDDQAGHEGCKMKTLEGLLGTRAKNVIDALTWNRRPLSDITVEEIRDASWCGKKTLKEIISAARKVGISFKPTVRCCSRIECFGVQCVKTKDHPSQHYSHIRIGNKLVYLSWAKKRGLRFHPDEQA